MRPIGPCHPIRGFGATGGQPASAGLDAQGTPTLPEAWQSSLIWGGLVVPPILPPDMG